VSSAGRISKGAGFRPDPALRGVGRVACFASGGSVLPETP